MTWCCRGRSRARAGCRPSSRGGGSAARGVVPNHVIPGTDAPSEWEGRAIRCRRLAMLRGVHRPEDWQAWGLAPDRDTGATRARRCRPVSARGPGCRARLHPTTKAASGHDEPMTRTEAAALVGQTGWWPS